jgi:hypothetical protein
MKKSRFQAVITTYFSAHQPDAACYDGLPEVVHDGWFRSAFRNAHDGASLF